MARVSRLLGSTSCTKISEYLSGHDVNQRRLAGKMRLRETRIAYYDVWPLINAARQLIAASKHVASTVVDVVVFYVTSDTKISHPIAAAAAVYRCHGNRMEGGCNVFNAKQLSATTPAGTLCVSTVVVCDWLSSNTSC